MIHSPTLKEFIQDKELAEPAIIALASTGSEAIPLLTEVFQTNTNSAIRAAAAKGLGEIGSHTGDPTITPPLLDYLIENLKHMKTSSDIDFPVLTEVVWSLGKLRNERSIPPDSGTRRENLVDLRHLKRNVHASRRHELDT